MSPITKEEESICFASSDHYSSLGWVLFDEAWNNSGLRKIFTIYK